MKKLTKLAAKVMGTMAFALVGVFGATYITGESDAFADCAALKGDGNYGVLDKATLDGCEGVKTINERIYGLAKVVAGIVLGFAVLMIVYAGFKYTTSQGDPKVTEQAKMQIIAAGIGIGIAMLAFVIVNVFQTLM